MRPILHAVAELMLLLVVGLSLWLIIEQRDQIGQLMERRTTTYTVCFDPQESGAALNVDVAGIQVVNSGTWLLDNETPCLYGIERPIAMVFREQHLVRR